MRRRLILGAIAAGTAVASMLPAHAAATVVKDVTGDANALNGQGLVGDPVPQDNSAPVSQPGFDITSVKFSSTFKGKAPQALVVTLTYAGKPDETSTVHRVTAEGAGDCETFMIQYYAEPTGNSSALRTCSDDPLGYTDVDLPMPKVSATAITWTIPYKMLKARGLKPGVTLTGLGAHNRLAHAATIPMVDGVASTASYRLGS